MLSYHYSEDAPWYFIYFILPAIASLLISMKLQFKFLERTGYALLPILIVGTIVGGYINKDYWGYAYKRPAVFKELNEALEISSFTEIEKKTDANVFVMSTDSTLKKDLFGRENTYYGKKDRPIMTFLDRSHIAPDLYYWYDIAKDPQKKITEAH